MSTSRTSALLRDENDLSATRNDLRGKRPHSTRRRYFWSLELSISEFHRSCVASGLGNESLGRPRRNPPFTRASPTIHSMLRSDFLALCLSFASVSTALKTLSHVSDVIFTLKILSSGQVRGESVKHRMMSSTTQVQHTCMLVRRGRLSNTARLDWAMAMSGVRVLGLH